MLADSAATFLQGVVREMFLAQADRNGPRSFDGVMEWTFDIGWDDGYQKTRITLMPGTAEWSESYGAQVRPVVVIAVDSDAQPFPPSGETPMVSRFGAVTEAQRAHRTPLAESPATPAGRWAAELMARMGGDGLRQESDGSLSFKVTLPDEPPWVAQIR